MPYTQEHAQIDRVFGRPVVDIEADLREEELARQFDYDMATEIAHGMRMPVGAIDIAIEQTEFTTALQRFSDDGGQHV